MPRLVHTAPGEFSTPKVENPEASLRAFQSLMKATWVSPVTTGILRPAASNAFRMPSVMPSWVRTPSMLGKEPRRSVIFCWAAAWSQLPFALARTLMPGYLARVASAAWSRAMLPGWSAMPLMYTMLPLPLSCLAIQSTMGPIHHAWFM